MKKNYLIVMMSVIMSLVLFWRCDDDDKSWKSEGAPSVQLSTDVIHTQQGRNILIEGNVTDNVGIRSINLFKEAWYLNKTIEFETNPVVTNYDLSYNFDIPADASDDETEVVITVTNLGGETYSIPVTVAMDGDFDMPLLSIVSPVDGQTMQPASPNVLEIACEISDARALGYFVLKEESLDIYDSISFKDQHLKEYAYSYSVDLGANPDNYSFYYTVADSAGNVLNQSTVVKVSADFDKMYLSDVATEADLTTDLFGVPMLIEKVAPMTFSAQYYSAQANTEIKFIPQKTSFSPSCYGIDPANPDKLINSSETALPIVLPEKGYYQIDINLETLEFSFEKFTPEDAPYSSYMNEDENDMNNYVGTLNIVGVGWTDFQNTTGWGWDGPNADKAMTVDPENPYLYTRQEELEGTLELIFAPYHPWGWWMSPFWRFDSKTEPEATVLGGGDNASLTVPAKANYLIVFDTYLNRAKVVLVE